MKNIYVVIILLFLFFTSCKIKDKKGAVIYTNKGNIELILYEKEAPVTSLNFMRYVDAKQYDGAKFYRTVCPDNQPNNNIKIEVIQGGLEYNPPHEEFPPIRHESTKETGIHHLDGTISMARADTGTVTSEFFICIGDQPELDYEGKRNPDLQGFAAFGQVNKGMNVVKRIQQLPASGQYLLSPVVIDSIRMID